MGYSVPAFREFIDSRSLIRLPGGVGTTLQLYGYELKPQAWSGEANLRRPDLVTAVHDAFHQTGADIHTTNSFRTHSLTMDRVVQDFPDEAERLIQACRAQSPLHQEFRSVSDELAYWATKRAVDAARDIQAKSDRPVIIGGSYGPLNDTHSYNPAATISYAEILKGHTEHALLLKDLGVDVLFPETIPTLDEARAMTQAALETGLPYITSFVLNLATGNLFDGTTIEQAVRETNSSNRCAVLFNCTPASAIGPAIDRLLTCYDGPVGAYPNGEGGPSADKVSWDHDESPTAKQVFVDSILLLASKDPRVKIFGGCCGAAPSYIEALNDTLREKPARPHQRFVASDEGHKAGHACACRPGLHPVG